MSFTVIALLLLVSAINMVWGGFVFQTLWGWFVVPVFNVIPLTLAMAAGLMLFVSYATYHRVIVPEDKKDWPDKISEALAHVLVYPAIMLGVGWCVKQFLQ